MGKIKEDKKQPVEQKENFNLSKRELKRRIDYLDNKLTDLIKIVDDISSDLHRVMNRMGLWARIKSQLWWK